MHKRFAVRPKPLCCVGRYFADKSGNLFELFTRVLVYFVYIATHLITIVMHGCQSIFCNVNGQLSFLIAHFSYYLVGEQCPL